MVIIVHYDHYLTTISTLMLVLCHVDSLCYLALEFHARHESPVTQQVDKGWFMLRCKSAATCDSQLLQKIGFF